MAIAVRVDWGDLLPIMPLRAVIYRPPINAFGSNRRLGACGCGFASSDSSCKKAIHLVISMLDIESSRPPGPSTDFAPSLAARR
jgi:hypothetical protein